MQELKRLEGTVAHITFAASDTGFTVLELDTDGEIITVVGEMAGIGIGQKLIVFGEYTTHPSFGVQFKASTFEVVLPSDANAILLYLSQGAVKGIGPVTAKRIVDAFGENTFDILDSDPVALSGLKGISYRQALEIQNEFKRIYGIQDAIRYLSAYGIQTHQTIALYSIYGANTVEIVSHNPYILCGDPCFIPFEMADEIADKVSLEYDSQPRVQGGIAYVLRHNTLKGHCCVPREKLVETVSKFIKVEPEKIESNITNQCETGLLMQEEIKGRVFIYLPELYVAELITAQKLIQLLQKKQSKLSGLEHTIELIEATENIKYADKQKEAMEKVMSSNVCIITGGPGTGKTTLVKGIISLFEMQGDRVSLCAPTGRAAKRLSELSGRPAKTIHRLLEVSPGSKNNIRFVRNQDNPIRCDVLIVDEFSMVDAVLFSQLITAVKDDCRVVLVGDYNQLPAVGPGNILKDLLECGLVPSVQLTDIFRQAQQSDIVVNAHAINHGLLPKTSSKQGDYFFLECGAQNIEDVIVGLIETRLPKAYGFDSFEDIQVLCPSRKRRGGTVNLNQCLQSSLNPEGANKAQITFNGVIFREGDKIMQIRNNYDLEYTKDDGDVDVGVFNGDIGYIKEVDKRSKTLTLRFDDKTYIYTQEDLNQIEHAWAVTVHKSQGCEFKAVILSLSDTAPELQYRNLLYTAFTRARDLLVVVGQGEIMGKMVASNRKQLRYSGIAHFMEEYNV